MLKHLFAFPYIIDKNRLSEQLDELLVRLKDLNIVGEYDITEELLRLILKFYTTVGSPKFNKSFLVDGRECPSSTKMNETWLSLDSDLKTLFVQQNVIDETLVVGYNYFSVGKENILNKLKDCNEKLTKVSSICSSKNSPVFEVTENFDTNSGIDFEFVPGGQQVNYDQFIGAITLGAESPESTLESNISNIAVKAYWNNLEISDQEFLTSPDVSDGKMYGIYGDHGENGIRIGPLVLINHSESVEPPVIEPPTIEQPPDYPESKDDAKAERRRGL